MSQQPPKVLRIGVIVDGKLTQERLIKAGETVTIGDAPKNTIVVPRLTLPKQDWPLFTVKGGKYVLAFTDTMKGKVGAGGAVTVLEKIRTEPSIERDGAGFKLGLSEQDRGKIQIDNVTVLFQFVTAPPTAARGAPRLDFRPRLVAEDDALLFGFLVLFGSIAGIFLLWARFATVDEDDGPMVLDEKWVQLLVDKPPPPPPTEVVSDAGTTKAEQPVETKAPEAKAGQEAKSAEPKSRDASKAEATQKSAVLQYLTTHADSNSGTARDMWQDSGGNQVVGSLDGVSGTVAASDGNTGQFRGGGGDGTGTAAGGDGISQIGVGAVAVADAPKVRTGSVQVEEGSGDDGEEGDFATVRKVVQRYNSQLRYCYENQLKTNPDLEGRVEMEWSVANGKVTEVHVLANTTKDTEFANCIAGKIKKWTFESYTGDVTFPFVFRPED